MSHYASNLVPSKGSGRSIDDEVKEEEDFIINLLVDPTDNQLFRNSKKSSFGASPATVIPVPGSTRKSNIPAAGFSPRDFNKQQQQQRSNNHIDTSFNERKRVLGQDSWNLSGVGPSPKRAAMGSWSESQSHSKPKKGQKKSENLSELLGKASNMDQEVKLDKLTVELGDDGSKSFWIPTTMVPGYQKRLPVDPPRTPAKGEKFSLDQEESEDDLDIVDRPLDDFGLLHPKRPKVMSDPDDIKADIFAANDPTRGLKQSGTTLHLLEFRRGGIKLESQEITLHVEPSGKYVVFEGNAPIERLSFTKDQFGTVYIEDNKGRVLVKLKSQQNDFPSGENIFWDTASEDLPLLLQALAGPTEIQYKSSQGFDARYKLFDKYPKPPPLHPPTLNKSPSQSSPHFVSLSKSTPISQKSKVRTRKEASPGDLFIPDTPSSNNLPLRRTTRRLYIEDVEDDPLPKAIVHRKFTPEPEWESPLVWPPDGAKRVTVDHVDLNRLNEGEFLNDNLINFYLRYIEEEVKRVNPELAQRTHFFNTFFYERLGKRPEKKGDNWGQENIQSLLKWTSRVDLFSKSFVVVPINEHYHWYLAIICNLDKLEKIARSSNEEVEPTNAGSADDTSVEGESNSTNTDMGRPDDGVEVVIDDKIPLNDSMAEQQSIPEENLAVTGNSGDPMNVDESPETDSSEWPDEDGLEGKSTDIRISKYTPRSDAIEKNGSKKPLMKPKKKITPPDSPTIFILDSLNTNSHSRTFKFLREYLQAEAKSKKQFEFPPKMILGGYAKVPEQPNFCDCGLYLLYYVERFLQRPDEFTQEFLRKEDTSASFDQADIVSMRRRLRGIIIKLKQAAAAEPEENSNASDDDGEIEETTRGPEVSILATNKETPLKRRDGSLPPWIPPPSLRSSEEPKEPNTRASSRSRAGDRGMGSDDNSVSVKKFTPERSLHSSIPVRNYTPERSHHVHSSPRSHKKEPRPFSVNATSRPHSPALDIVDNDIYMEDTDVYDQRLTREDQELLTQTSVVDRNGSVLTGHR